MFQGTKRDHEAQFREWFAHIGELRSLCTKVPILALTATASPTHRRQIMQKRNASIVVDSPDRTNIKMSVQKVKNNVDIADIFQWTVIGLNGRKHDFPRHIIFVTLLRTVHLFKCFF